MNFISLVVDSAEKSVILGVIWGWVLAIKVEYEAVTFILGTVATCLVITNQYLQVRKLKRELKKEFKYDKDKPDTDE